MALETLAKRADQGGLSLATFGEQEYERRELAGMRSAGKALARWRTHVASSKLGKLPLRTVAVDDVVRFVDELSTRRQKPGKGHGNAVADARARKLISSRTAEAILVAVRVVLGSAADRRLIKSNPAAGVRLPREVRKRARTEDPWTYLTPDEQSVLISDGRVPLRERLAAMFAVGTGARQNEQWSIELADLDLDRGQVTLRHTKNGKPRVVHLTPIARAAVEEWLPMLEAETAANRARAERRGREVFKPSGLLWPRERGTKRAGDHPRWQEWTEMMFPKAKRHDRRHVRWHDLRHTCGTSLMCGWWGARLSKEEVQAMLDHESVTTTERYAHIAEDFLGSAVSRLSQGWEVLTTPSPRVVGDAQNQAPPARLERATFALGSTRLSLVHSHGSVSSGDNLETLEAEAVKVLRLVDVDGGVDVDALAFAAVALARRAVAVARRDRAKASLRSVTSRVAGGAS